LHATWRDKIPNKLIRGRTRQEELGCIIRRKRLAWLGHVDMNRKAKQVLNWTPGRKMGRGRPRTNWPETIREDLRGLELTLEDALDAAEDRDSWRKRIARCAVQHGTD